MREKTKCYVVLPSSIACVVLYFLLLLSQVWVLASDLMVIRTDIDLYGNVWDSYHPNAEEKTEVYEVIDVQYSLEDDTLQIVIQSNINRPDNLEGLNLEGEDTIYCEVDIDLHRDPVKEVQPDDFSGGCVWVFVESDQQENRFIPKTIAKFDSITEKSDIYGAQFKLKQLLDFNDFYITLKFNVGDISRDLEIYAKTQVNSMESQNYSVSVVLPYQYEDPKCRCEVGDILTECPKGCDEVPYDKTKVYNPEDKSAKNVLRIIKFPDHGDGGCEVSAVRSIHPSWALILSAISAAATWFTGESVKSCKIMTRAERFVERIVKKLHLRKT